MASVSWPARLEVVGQRPLVIVDCAHNLASAQALVQTLRTSVPLDRTDAPTPGRHLIFAGSSDKDLAGMLRILAPRFTHLYFTRYGNSARGVPPEQLAAMVRQTSGVRLTVWPEAPASWAAARAAARPEDLICITGSVFLAGELWPIVTGRGI